MLNLKKSLKNDMFAQAIGLAPKTSKRRKKNKIPKTKAVKSALKKAYKKGKSAGMKMRKTRKRNRY